MKSENELVLSFNSLPIQDSLITDELTLIRSTPFREYLWKGVTIIEKEPLTSDTYPLSTKEVLTVINYYGCIDMLKKVIISNHRKVNLQGIEHTLHDKVSKCIELHIPSDLSQRSGLKGSWKLMAKSTPRWCALFTLLHELGHVMMYDYTYINHAIVEPKCDEFALVEITKFTKNLIKGCK